MRDGLRLIVPARTAIGTHRLPAEVEIVIYFFILYTTLISEYFDYAVIITLPVIALFALILCHIFHFPKVFALVRPGPCNVRLRLRIYGTCALAILPAVRLRYGARSQRIKGENVQCHYPLIYT